VVRPGLGLICDRPEWPGDLVPVIKVEFGLGRINRPVLSSSPDTGLFAV